MTTNEAIACIRSFDLDETIADLYDDDEELQEALNVICPEFEYPDHSYKTLEQFLKQYS